MDHRRPANCAVGLQLDTSGTPEQDSGRAHLDHGTEHITGHPAEAPFGRPAQQFGRGDHQSYLLTLGAVMAATSGVRRLGVASLDLAYVAAGRLDGFWEFNLQPWDLAAGLLVVREAGGYVSDAAAGQGMLATGDVVAANDYLHPLLVQLLKKAHKEPAAK